MRKPSKPASVKVGRRRKRTRAYQTLLNVKRLKARNGAKREAEAKKHESDNAYPPPQKRRNASSIDYMA